MTWGNIILLVLVPISLAELFKGIGYCLIYLSFDKMAFVVLQQHELTIYYYKLVAGAQITHA